MLGERQRNSRLRRRGRFGWATKHDEQSEQRR
jgi:hypothetical protein